MFKRIIALILMLSALLSLSACGGNDKDEKETKKETQASDAADVEENDSIKEENTAVDNSKREIRAPEVLSDIKVQNKGGRYTLELSKEQLENFKSAKFYILCRNGYGMYYPFYSSENVVLEGNTLTADFDGYAVYIKDSYNNYCLPDTVEVRNDGDNRQFFINGVVTNGEYTGDDFKSRGIFYAVTANNESHELTESKLFYIPEDKRIDFEQMTEEKYTLADLSGYVDINFYDERSGYIIRNEDQSIPGLSQWPLSGDYTWNTFYLSNGVEAVFAPLPEGEYYFIMEVTGSDDSCYCTELTKIDSSYSFPQVHDSKEKEPLLLKCKEGEGCELGEVGGVALYMYTEESSLYGERSSIRYTNNNNYPITINITDVYVNGNIYADAGYGMEPYMADDEYNSFDCIEPGQSVSTNLGIDLSEIANISEIEKIDSLRFLMSVTDYDKNESTLSDQEVIIELPGHNTELYTNMGDEIFDYPSRKVLAEKQVLYDKNGTTVTLMGLGCIFGSTNDIHAAVKVENSSKYSKYFTVEQIFFDDVGMSVSCSGTVEAESIVYKKIKLKAKDLDRFCIFTAEKMGLIYGETDTFDYFKSFMDYECCDIKLSEYGAAVPFAEGEKVIFEENGIRMALVSLEGDENKPEWYISVVNETDKDYTIILSDIIENGTAVPKGSYYYLNASQNICCAGKKTLMSIKLSESELPKDLSCKLCFLDLGEEEILGISGSRIELIKDSKILDVE